MSESRLPSHQSSDKSPRLNRRSFLGGLTASALAGIAWPREFLAAASTAPKRDRFGELLPMRPLSTTGEHVTMLGIGGQHFRWLPEDQLERAIETAIAGGVRFFDTANAYGRNELSERLYGKYLTPKYRDVIYLMSKTSAKDPETARKHLDLSLRNMKTDVMDLWQLHNVTSVEDAHRRWDEGVVDVFLAAQQAGKVRMIGFTGHHDIRAHLEMLSLFKQRGVGIQTVQMPVNVVDPDYESFIKEVIPVAQSMGVALLGMKSMCGGRLFGGVGEGWGTRGKISAEPIVPNLLPLRDATDYVWSLPIATRIAGFDSVDQIQEHIDAARHLQSLTPNQQSEILKIASQRSGPVMEYYKREVRG